MKSFKYLVLLPLLLLSSCGSENLGRRITANEAEQRIYEIERFNANYIPAFRITCDVSINAVSGMTRYSGSAKILLEANNNGEGHGKLQLNINGAGYGNVNESIEGYTVRNYEGYEKVTWLKLSSSLYGTSQVGTFINNQDFSDFANSSNSAFVYNYVDVMEEPYYYAIMAYPRPSSFIDTFADLSGYFINTNYYSSGTGSLSVKVTVKKSSNANNSEVYYLDSELESGEMTLIYKSYLITKLTLTEKTSNGSKGTVNFNVTYPQNLSFRLPNGWRSYIEY